MRDCHPTSPPKFFVVVSSEYRRTSSSNGRLEDLTSAEVLYALFGFSTLSLGCTGFASIESRNSDLSNFGTSFHLFVRNLCL